MGYPPVIQHSYGKYPFIEFIDDFPGENFNVNSFSLRES
jgi:hypothetical protein